MTDIAADMPAVLDEAPAQPEPEPAPTADELRAATLRAAVLEARSEDAKAAAQVARVQAEQLYARARRAGTKQVAVVLPGGVEAGLMAIQAGATDYDVDEADLMALIAPVLPSEVEDYALPAAEHDPAVLGLLQEFTPDLTETRVRPGALDDERAVKVLAEHAPALVGRRLRLAFRAEMQKEIEKNEGKVPDPDTGELVQVAAVTHHEPTGKFAWSGKAKNIGRVREAIAAGLLDVTATGEVIVGDKPEGQER